MENVPQILHCYFSFESGLEFLKTRKFRLSSIFQFNDPFEFLIKTDYPLFFLSLKEDTTDEKIDLMVDQLRNDNFCVLGETVKRKAKGFVKRMNMFRIGCFSEIDNNILMWSHYARKHTGILISFNTALDYWGNDFHNVIYTPDRIYIREFSENELAGNKQEKQLLIQKAPYWNYEQEWRYIKCINADCSKDDDGYYKDIDHNCISKIVIGCKINENDYIKFKQVITDDYSDTKVYRAEPTYGDYSLTMRNITDTFVR